MHLRAGLLRTGSLTQIYTRMICSFCVSTMNNEELISKVQMNPAIWDKRIKDHHQKH
ncbi:unnamed protein product [Callosobruchus maculatus]|uniref:Uncharacterized protein n=1 Tax=Callosobruchus maculatus TaxID=64391 RepID=A0A653D2H6_CALMS|nr:unnamed protein product [Callosobruchus maculatus]